MSRCLRDWLQGLPTVLPGKFSKWLFLSLFSQTTTQEDSNPNLWFMFTSKLDQLTNGPVDFHLAQFTKSTAQWRQFYWEKYFNI